MNEKERHLRLESLVVKPSENKKGGYKRVHIWITATSFVPIDVYIKMSHFKNLKVVRKGKRSAVLFGPLGQYADIFDGQKGYILIRLIKGE